uniref:Uncharacterized protein n=1 Tax=Romanomermis culicivorax TaxID=13658 RepID=A0A915K9M9_ROMCU
MMKMDANDRRTETLNETASNEENNPQHPNFVVEVGKYACTTIVAPSTERAKFHNSTVVCFL